MKKDGTWLLFVLRQKFDCLALALAEMVPSVERAAWGVAGDRVWALWPRVTLTVGFYIPPYDARCRHTDARTTPAEQEQPRRSPRVFDSIDGSNGEWRNAMPNPECA